MLVSVYLFAVVGPTPGSHHLAVPSDHGTNHRRPAVQLHPRWVCHKAYPSAVPTRQLARKGQVHTSFLLPRVWTLDSHCGVADR